MSYRDPNPYSASTSHGTLPENYQVPNEALERAEFEADVDHHKKRQQRPGLIGRIKALFTRPAR